MRASDIARQYDLPRAEFEAWLPGAGVPFSRSSGGRLRVDNSVDLDDLAMRFRVHRGEDVRARTNRAADLVAGPIVEEPVEPNPAELEKQAALANMLITSGFNFEGYRIVRYSGYISGDDAVGTAAR